MRQTGPARGHSLKAMALQWGSWAALAAGAVLCAVGWYGVSGERFAERQIPYLASCTIPGAALIVAGAVLLSRGDQGLAAARVEELYGLLVAADGEGAGASAGPAPTRGAGCGFYRTWRCPAGRSTTGPAAPSSTASPAPYRSRIRRKPVVRGGR